jgi:hypothetical protein
MNVFHSISLPDKTVDLWASLVDQDDVELTERVAMGACSYGEWTHGLLGEGWRINVGGERRCVPVALVSPGKSVFIVGCAHWRQPVGGEPYFVSQVGPVRLVMESVSAEFDGNGGMRFAIKEADEDAAVDHSATVEKESA